VDTNSEPWWKTAVVYQIYPRSFCDTTGNGVGDIDGITAHLDHLGWLGVDAIWLSPVFRSPMVDHGYDISDYCDIDPLFGDLVAIDTLIDESHARDIRVILDWVPNHSSDQHPWFLESRSDRTNPKRNWYIWRDGGPSTPPNNWQAEFPPGPAWKWDDQTQAWYLHMFAPEQPDLNWAEPAVREAMYDTLRFWLDRGVDGFRMDVVHLLGKPDALPDRAKGPGRPLTEFDNQVTHEYLREIRAVLDRYEGDRMAVGEVYLLDPARVADYYGSDDELHLSFNFMPLWSEWDATVWREQIRLAADAFDPVDAWATWVLSNHDVPRHRSRYGGNEQTARAAAVLLLCLRGTPFMYAGEEFGLLDADVPPEMAQDPAGYRDGCRAPLPWDGSNNHGWVKPDNWLPFPPEADTRNASAQMADSGSIAALYKAVLAARRRSPALQIGTQRILETHQLVLAFHRVHGTDERIIVVNMSDEDVDSIAVGSGWQTEVRSDTTDAIAWTQSLPSQTAIILKPA
jgi:alpha-glucosidase